MQVSLNDTGCLLPTIIEIIKITNQVNDLPQRDSSLPSPQSSVPSHTSSGEMQRLLSHSKNSSSQATNNNIYLTQRNRVAFQNHIGTDALTAGRNITITHATTCCIHKAPRPTDIAIRVPAFIPLQFMIICHKMHTLRLRATKDSNSEESVGATHYRKSNQDLGEYTILRTRRHTLLHFSLCESHQGILCPEGCPCIL